VFERIARHYATPTRPSGSIVLSCWPEATVLPAPEGTKAAFILIHDFRDTLAAMG